MIVLIWIQTVWHLGGIFDKIHFEKNQQMTKSMQISLYLLNIELHFTEY